MVSKSLVVADDINYDKRKVMKLIIEENPIGAAEECAAIIRLEGIKGFNFMETKLLQLDEVEAIRNYLDEIIKEAKEDGNNTAVGYDMPVAEPSDTDPADKDRSSA